MKTHAAVEWIPSPDAKPESYARRPLGELSAEGAARKHAEFTESAFGKCAPGDWDLRSAGDARVTEIGRSREGRALYGIVVGTGPLRASIVAGAHADEPVGPRTALHFAAQVAAGRGWPGDLAAHFTFYIVPHMNPDGDARNAEWQRHPGDFESYARNVVREQPGEDVEFGWPRDKKEKDARSENRAAAEFLRGAGGPFALHASLHSMGVAEGAQFLICREWGDRAREAGVFERLANAAGRAGLLLHDQDRGGEKGFFKLAPGFATTPVSTAMRDFFLKEGDKKMAALFRPSSMEFAQSLGGDPLCLVSEIPYFTIRQKDEPGAAYTSFRNDFAAARLTLAKGDDAALDALQFRYQVRPIAWTAQRDLQMEFLREGLRLAAARAEAKPKTSRGSRG
ncbi:M14 family zinc carboxypeptidase [soil metagenome]